jgi:AcrR family transcriptional regulator
MAATVDRRQEIVSAAMTLADRHGLDAVSMRNIAELLGVGTMTLYGHVDGKDEVLDLIADELSREMLVPEPVPEHWRSALREIAVRTRDAIGRHPWVTGAMGRRRAVRINTMRHIEQSIAALSELDVDPPAKTKILMAVDDYVFGHALRTDARARQAQNNPGPPKVDDEVRAAIDAGELPLLAKAIARRSSRTAAGLRPPADFEQGLDWLLDGIEAEIARGR